LPLNSQSCRIQIDPHTHPPSYKQSCYSPHPDAYNSHKSHKKPHSQTDSHVSSNTTSDDSQTPPQKNFPHAHEESHTDSCISKHDSPHQKFHTQKNPKYKAENIYGAKHNSSKTVPNPYAQTKIPDSQFFQHNISHTARIIHKYTSQTKHKSNNKTTFFLTHKNLFIQIIHHNNNNKSPHTHHTSKNIKKYKQINTIYIIFFQTKTQHKTPT